MDTGRLQGCTEIHGEALSDDEPMLALMESFDFIARRTDDADEAMEVSRSL